MKRFRYSRVRPIMTALPFIVGGVMIASDGPGLQRLAGWTLAAGVFTVFVLAVRIRVDCYEDYVEVRYLRTPIKYSKGTIIEGHFVQHLIGRSRLLTFIPESGRRRSLSLEFFSRDTRSLVATEVARSLHLLDQR